MSIFSSQGIPIKRYKELLDSYYGDEWYSWDGEALILTIENDFGVTIIDEVVDKLRAIQALRMSNKVYTEAYPFEKVVCALNGIPLLPDFIQGAEPEEIAYAIREILSIFPEAQFGNEVAGYIASILAEDGFIVVPDILSFVSPMLRKINSKSIAGEAEKAVLEEIDRVKNGKGTFSEDSLAGNAAAKYISILAYLKEKGN